jgi:hypothetical protein
MLLDFEALANYCERCCGRHPTALHYARKVAASTLGRDFSVQDAAERANLPAATVQAWAEHDPDFREQIVRARRRAARREPAVAQQRATRRLARAARKFARRVRGAVGPPQS